MKTFCLIFIIALTLLSYTNRIQAQSDQLTQQQNNQIKKEIKALSDSLFVRETKLDINVLTFYSPHIVVVRDTVLYNYKEWEKAWADFLTYASSINWTPYKWDCIIIAKDLAFSSYVGKFEFAAKSGDKTTIDPIGWAYVWKKTDGQWKVIYENYSGIHVTQKADKK